MVGDAHARLVERQGLTAYADHDARLVASGLEGLKGELGFQCGTGLRGQPDKLCAIRRCHLRGEGVEGSHGHRAAELRVRIAVCTRCIAPIGFCDFVREGVVVPKVVVGAGVGFGGIGKIAGVVVAHGRKLSLVEVWRGPRARPIPAHVETGTVIRLRPE